MDFIKKNWQLLTCGLVAAGGIGVGVWQAMAASEVKTAMQPAIQLGSTLDSASKGKMYNTAWIDAKRQENAAAEAKFQATVKDAQQRQEFVAFEERIGADGKEIRAERKPLVDNVLPTSTKTQPKIEFRQRYKVEFSRLFDRLQAGSPPAPADVQDWIDKLTKLRDAKMNIDPWSLRTGDSSATPVNDNDSPDRVRTLMNDPESRAALEKAKNIHGMYVDDTAIGMHPMATMMDTPTDEQIWQAQMSLWIQQDLVTALARVNEKATAEMVKAGRSEDAWVAHLPIKRLKMLSVGPLLGGPGGGGSNAPAGGWAFPSFLARDNDERFFVVPLAVSVVVESDAMPQLLSELVAVSFFTPVRINYNCTQPNPFQHRFIYGSAKVIEVEISLEASYLHSIFGKWMPPSIQQQLTHPAGADLATLLGSMQGGPSGMPGGVPGAAGPRGRP